MHSNTQIFDVILQSMMLPSIGQTDTQIHRQIDKRKDRQTDRQAGRQTDRQTDRQTGRQTDRQADRQTGRQTDKTMAYWRMQERKPAFTHISRLFTLILCRNR